MGFLAYSDRKEEEKGSNIGNEALVPIESKGEFWIWLSLHFELEIVIFWQFWAVFICIFVEIIRHRSAWRSKAYSAIAIGQDADSTL